MTKEYRFALMSGCAGALILLIGSQFPALTSGGLSGAAPIPEAEFQQLVQGERDHCEDALDGVNCECFAGVSGIIQANAGPKVPTATYANQQDLARGQAERKC